jgi:hypothetical protein
VWTGRQSLDFAFDLCRTGVAFLNNNKKFAKNDKRQTCIKRMTPLTLSLSPLITQIAFVTLFPDIFACVEENKLFK